MAEPCRDDEHEWGPPRRMSARSGPLDGEWVLQECRRCNAGAVSRTDGADGLPNLLAALGVEAVPEPRDLT